MATPRQPKGAPRSIGGRSRPDARNGVAATYREWPVMSYENGDPIPDDVLDSVSRTQRRMATMPYQAAVPPAIADTHVPLSSELLADASEAEAALARFDAVAERSLGAGTTVGNLDAILLRTESASSSQIEGITAGAKKVAIAVLGDSSAGENAELIARNTLTMRSALEMSGRLDEEAILEMHAALLKQHLPDHAGVFRSRPVWIGGGQWPAQAKFVPPRHSRVRAAMADLVEFADRVDVPAIAHIAITHAQFETIHPFVDGNGRTGRAVVQAMARSSGITRHITAPISAGLLRDTSGYFDALAAYQAGDPSPIVNAFSAASLFAASSGERLATNLADTREQILQQAGARSDSGAHMLAQHLIEQPVVDTKYVHKLLDGSEMTAFRAIERLVTAGVLRQTSGQRRNRMWQADQVLEILDGFAASIRRDRG